MRIIAGVFKGHHLRAPKSAAVRPTTDRVKESIFNIAAHHRSFSDSNVLDLYAGSGSLGLEALSRGAARAVFVENSHRSITILSENVAHLHCHDRCLIVHNMVERYVHSTQEQFDFIFTDPPYLYDAYETLAEEIAEKNLLREGGILLLQYSSRKEMTLSARWHLMTSRLLGETTISFYQLKKPEVIS